jgi:hypothetical protein
MTSYSETVLRLAGEVLQRHRVKSIVHAGGFNTSRPGCARRIPDIAAIIADFERIEARVDLVADAIAAHALDEMGIKHSISSHGLRLQIRTPKQVVEPRHYPMNMCWER